MEGKVFVSETFPEHNMVVNLPWTLPFFSIVSLFQWFFV